MFWNPVPLVYLGKLITTMERKYLIERHCEERSSLKNKMALYLAMTECLSERLCEERSSLKNKMALYLAMT